MKNLLLGLLMTGVGMAADWPEWLGPDQDGTWDEEGVIAAFPEGGPKVLWREPVGLGYSGPSISEGKVFLMDYLMTEGAVVNNPGKAVEIKGKERVRCYDAETGRPVWEHATERAYELSYPAGPRSTVTVSGGKAYALGGMGHLMCLDAKSGALLWEKDLVKLYEPGFPIWGYSAHPLVHDGLVVTMVGGEGSSVVAFDAATGEEKWKALSSKEPGYCPPTVIEYGGTEQMIVFTPEGYKELDKSQVLKPTNEAFGRDVVWTAPAFAMKSVFVRNDEELVRVDLSASGGVSSEQWKKLAS